MPPDVVRPLATATLGNVLVIAHRLGMDWISVRPNDSHLHAQGHGQSLTSIEIRSLGLALRYTNKDPQREINGDFTRLPTATFKGSRPLSHLFIPTKEADKLAFGFIPADPELKTAEYCVAVGSRNFDGIQDTLIRLNVRWKAVQYCTKGIAGQNFFADRSKSPGWNGIADAIYLLSPWMPLLGLGAVRVRLPYSTSLQTPFNWREGHIVFWLRLKELVKTSPTCTSSTRTSSLPSRQLRRTVSKQLHPHR